MNTNVPTACSDWAKIAASFEQAESLSPEETEQIRDGLNYLRLKLGEGILSRLEAQWGLRHPLFWFLGTPFNSAPSTRLGVVNWSKNLQALEGCQNVGRVLSDFERPNKCKHAYRLVEVSAALAREGIKILLEPPPPDLENTKHADALLEYPPTKERFYLELSCQGLASTQLEAFKAMSDCYAPLWKVDPGLRFSGKLMKMPAETHLEEISRRVEAAGRRALAEGRLVEVIDGDTLEMAICPLDKLPELESWCKERSLSPQGFAGPPDDTSPAGRLGHKIKTEQEQLPPGSANVLVLENNSVFSHAPDVLTLISELEEKVYKYRHVAIVIVRGRYDTYREELPWKLEEGEHRFEHQARVRHVEEILLLSNRFADVKPSEELRARLLSAFFGSDSDGPHPATEQEGPLGQRGGL
jgi:hypothetical protein